MKLYNTLTRSLEPFEPRDPAAVTIYVCGPTVYDDPHIGHTRSAYIFDLLRRHLKHKRYGVRFVRNVTDVDDKIIEKARQESEGRRQKAEGRDVTQACDEISKRYLQRYHETMDRLGIERPDIEPLATEHVVPEMTDLIAKLLMAGAAYEAQGDVYFSVRKFPGYGALSNRTLDALKAGARIEPGERPGPPGAPAGAGKQDPLDFALWKAAKPGEPSWESPWGSGRPGWHIECSAMSMKHLGDAFDIHGGGVDLVFPHHENEIAQAQAAGKPFAKYWIHNGLLTVNGEKMSKSLGNFITIEQVLRDYPHPDYLKLFFLKTHYRSPIDYSAQKMEEAKKNWEEFIAFYEHSQQASQQAPRGTQIQSTVPNFRGHFFEAMDDDLNTPRALAVLFDVVNQGQQLLASGGLEGVMIARGFALELIELGLTLGLFMAGMSQVDLKARQDIEALIQERDQARKAKDFSRADAIRKQLQEAGYHLTDFQDKTVWRKS